MIDKGQWREFGQDTGVTPLLFTMSVMGWMESGVLDKGDIRKGRGGAGRGRGASRTGLGTTKLVYSHVCLILTVWCF